MRYDTDNFEEIAQAFPYHHLQLDIALEASDIWKTTAFCSAEFSKLGVKLVRITHQNGGQLLLRFACENSDDITRIKRCFGRADAPEVLRWTTTIGRIISSKTSSNLSA
ncbi:MAG: hypothetical protein ABJO09_15210 [Hyphomicrobiales bacterium]